MRASLLKDVPGVDHPSKHRLKQCSSACSARHDSHAVPGPALKYRRPRAMSPCCQVGIERRVVRIVLVRSRQLDVPEVVRLLLLNCWTRLEQQHWTLLLGRAQQRTMSEPMYPIDQLGGGIPLKQPVMIGLFEESSNADGLAKRPSPAQARS